MKIACPKCQQVIPASRVNVGTSLAFCDKCNEAFSLPNLAATGQVSEEFDVNNPPPGAWFEDTGSGWRIGAIIRSPLAFFLVPFWFVWAAGSLGIFYGSQIVNGQFNLGFSLFGIPFLLGAIAEGYFAWLMVFGKVIVSVEADEGSVFTGVGRFGWTRRFSWSSVFAVEEGNANQGASDNAGKVIMLVGQSRLTFGMMLSEARRYFMLQCMRKCLAARKR